MVAMLASGGTALSPADVGGTGGPAALDESGEATFDVSLRRAEMDDGQAVGFRVDDRRALGRAVTQATAQGLRNEAGEQGDRHFSRAAVPAETQRREQIGGVGVAEIDLEVLGLGRCRDRPDQPAVARVGAQDRKGDRHRGAPWRKTCGSLSAPASELR
ncbi:protein of unknown function (plasmid) [Rhodovastum atsumiense]|nr:protein of unknown function [Rhodovastum atsumiense]